MLVWFTAKNGVYCAKDGYYFWADQNRADSVIQDSLGWSKI